MSVNGSPAEPFVSRVKIRSYKSIGECDVELKRLTVLVGRNGSGKSNFLDALRFVTDGLVSSLSHAIKSRGGIEEVRRRSTGHPRNVSIELTLNLADWRTACYGFEISAKSRGAFSVKEEYLRVLRGSGEVDAEFRVESGQLAHTLSESMPPVAIDRLYLVHAAGLPQFRPIYDALTAMGFYNLNPQAMKDLQSPDAGELLHREGGNIASVIGRLAAENESAQRRIKDYLRSIVPGITDVNRVPLGPKETLEFRQQVEGSKDAWRFHAANVSDGTLRALGILVAVGQLNEQRIPVRLVGIEEPETALHPASTRALMDALREASTHTQVVVTTHSPDLLDSLDLADDQLLVVQADQGKTSIARVDEASLESIRNHLQTAGDLLRMDQLEPDRADLERQVQLEFGLEPMA